MVTLRCIKNPFTMKKIILVLVSLLTLVPVFSRADNGDVIFVVIVRGTDPQEIPRSVTPEVECSYLVAPMLLELQFNADLGDVTIMLTDASDHCVFSTWVNTSLEDSAEINVPSAPGSYLIEISGADYYGFGSFCVR